MKTDNEQCRTYTWITKDRAPAIKIVQPKEVKMADGIHEVKGSDNKLYIVKNWDLLEIELRGGVLVDPESKIIV